MPTRCGVSITLEMDKKKMEEFNVTTDSKQRQVTAWVASEQGKKFRIACSLPPDETNYDIRAWIDGREITLPESRIFYNSSHIGGPPFYMEGEENYEHTAIRKFMFGNLDMTDDDYFLDRPTQEFGQILLTVTSAQNYSTVTEVTPSKKAKISQSGGTDSQSQSAQVNDAVKEWGEDDLVHSNYTVHERSKLIGGSCVRFDKPIFYKTSQPKPSKVSKFSFRAPQTDAKPKPIVKRFTNFIGKKKTYTFVFYYRTMDFLLAKGYAPNKVKETSNQTPKKRKRSRKDVDDDEDYEEDGKTIKQLKAEIAKLQAKNGEASASGVAATLRPRPAPVEYERDPADETEVFDSGSESDW